MEYIALPDLFSKADGPPVLEGLLQHILYANPESGWTVGRLEVEGELEAITIVGNLAGVKPGESLRLQGQWVDDRRYGRQFQVNTCLSILPSTLKGIERYLGSGFVRGIGPVMAQRLVAHFGDQTLRVIEQHPERLSKVPGLGRVRMAAIRQAWKEQREVRDVMVFLQSYGVSAAHASRIYKKYGAESIATVRENPYQLAQEIAGIGFQSADKIARALGIAADAPQRTEAVFLHLLSRAAEEGHCFLPRRRLEQRCLALAQAEGEDLAASVATAIDTLGAQRRLVVEADDPRIPVYLARTHELEQRCAAMLLELSRASSADVSPQPEEDVVAFERESGLELAGYQRQALVQALRCKVMVITGGPGTGKTTLVRGLSSIFEKRRRRVVLCAPTGRAAKRLSETTQREASTIHRLLEWSPRGWKFQRNAAAPLEGDLFIVDETSMVDLHLLFHFLDAIPPGARLLLVGDADQLPSVGAGAVLADIIASEQIHTLRLTTIFRQLQDSLIVANAHRIRDGIPPQLPPPGARADFVLIERQDVESVLATLRLLVAERLPASLHVDPLSDLQVLVPMNRGPLGTVALNTELQQVLNPRGEPIGSTGMRVGDKVMQVRNNYDLEVYNGDIGSVAGCDPSTNRIEVVFEDRTVRYDDSELNELTLAYACTVHKSQGSEYPVVILVLHPQHHIMLQRNLLYTAVTRAKRQVILLGQEAALQTALRNVRRLERYTRLAERMRT